MEKRSKIADYSKAINAAFGAKLRQLRRSREVSQGELATRVGLSRVTIATIEGGKQNTQLQHVYHFAKALDVPYQDILPSPQDIERFRTMTGSDYFLEDARALLLQLKRAPYVQQAAHKETD